MPAAIGGGVIALLGSVGVAIPAGAATAIGTVILAGAAIGAQLLLAPRPKSPKADDLKTETENKEGPGRFAFGRVRVEGKRVFGQTAGYEIDQLLAMYFGPASATEEFYYDSREIVVEPNGEVSSPPFARLNGSYITLQSKVGDGTETAWPDLISRYPSLWTSEHRLRGIAQTLATFTNPGTGDSKFAQLYTGGIKKVERLDRAGEFYDPRDAQTRWSMNSVLICLHYRMMRPGVSLSDFDLMDLATVADACDAAVTKLSGQNLYPTDAPDTIFNNGSSGAWSNNVFSNVGTSGSATRPGFRWSNLLTIGTTYMVRLVVTGDVSAIEQIRAGGNNIWDANDATTAITYNGQAATEIVGSAVCTTNTHFQIFCDGRNGNFSFTVQAARLYVVDTTGIRSQLSGGGEGEITTEFVESLLQSAGLEEIRTDAGLITFRLIEDYPAAEITLTTDHIGQTINRLGPEGVKRPNVCRVKYFSPERQYAVAEVPVQTFEGLNSAYDGPDWARVESEIAIYGEHEVTYELEFCPDAAQALRIARRLFHMERARTGAVQTNFAGQAAWGLRTANLDLPGIGVDGGAEQVRARIAAPRTNDAAGTTEIGFTVIPEILQTAFDHLRDEVGGPPVLPVQQYEAELDTPAMPSAAGAVQYPSGGWELRARFAPVTDATIVEASYRTYTGGLPNQWAGMDESGLTLGYTAGDFRGQQADFRVRMFNADEEGSFFSDVLAVGSIAEDNTTPSAPIQNVVAQNNDNQPPFDVTVIVPNTISVVSIRLDIVNGSGPPAQDARPGETVNFVGLLHTGGGTATMTVNAIAITTDGTEGPPSATFSYTPPGP